MAKRSTHMELHIRRARADDMAHIMALQARSLRELSVGTYSSEQIEALVRSQGQARVCSFNAGDEIIYLAYTKAAEGELSVPAVADGESSMCLVAIAAFVFGRSQVGGLYVHPDFVRRGVASQLLQAIELEAASQQHRVLRVMSSLMAVPFYEARGFRRLFSRTVYFGDEMVSCVEMAKPLKSDSLLLEMTKQMAVTVGSLMMTVVVVWCAVFWI